MLNLNALFPGVHRASRIALTGCFLLVGTVIADAMPDYVRIALHSFSPEVPGNWAYSMTTDRDGRRATERFDPSKPPAEQWSLLRTEGRTPTSEEQEKYFKYKASHAPGAAKATFQKDDIEPGSIKLEHEDADRAEFTCTFREQSSNADKMMRHLGLRFMVNKHQPHVEKFRLTLNAPYSPVLGVKMEELVVAMNFSPPTADRASLPAESTSHFTGKIFFVPVEENLSFSYFDFTPVR